MNILIRPIAGRPRIREAVLRVQSPTQTDICHIVVIDGEPRRASAEAILEEVNFQGRVMEFPQITERMVLTVISSMRTCRFWLELNS